MPYVPPYDNIDEPNVTNFLEQDIYYNTEEKANILRQVEDMKVRQQRYLENGDTRTANNVQKKIDSFNAYADRLQEQIDGSTADLAVAQQRRRPTQTDTAQNELDNNPPSDNNPEVETLPLEEEAAIEEEVIFEADDQGEVIDVPEPLSEEDAVDVESQADVVNDSNTNEELATEPLALRTPVVETTAELLPQEVYVEYPNILHNYPSYTYGLSLHLLTADDWNDLSTTGNYQPKNVLIASAGKFDQTLGPNKLLRNKYFNEDFYFDSLDMLTVIGPTDSTPGSNAITLNFTIHEPYGVTLLDRIIAATKDLSASEKTTNYLENPYMVQIDFYGQNENGTLSGPIEGITKYIPIKLIDFNFDVTTNGSKYNIQAIPFNHGAFDLTTQKTPRHLEIVAGTVEDFFNAGSLAEDTKTFKDSNTNDTNQRKEYESNLNSGIDIKTVNPALMQNLQNAKTQVYKVTGYASGWNGYQSQLLDNKNIRYKDTIRFFFDDKIGQARLLEDNKNSPQDTAMIKDLEKAAAYKDAFIANPALGQPTVYFDKRVKKHAINYGTTIEAVIEDIITNSTYISDQILDPTKYPNTVEGRKDYIQAMKKNKDKPFKWFKIIPEIKLEKFDTTTMRWSRTITYNVVPYEVRNSKLSTMPGAKAKIPLKKYKYLYTGENIDILNIDIKYQAAYFTSVTSHASKLTKDKGMIQEDSGDAVLKDTEINAQNTIMPIHLRHQVSDSRRNATGGGKTTQQMANQDASKSILTEATGDMISVDLEIIGDPLFIKQDDIFYQQSVQKTKFTSGRITPNGSFITDTGEVYVQIDINSATDVMESEGKYDLNKSLFDGIYRVLQVNSKFESGQFTQVVKLTRLFNQDIDEEQIDDGAEQRSETATQTDGEYDPAQSKESKTSSLSVDSDVSDLQTTTNSLTNEVAADSLPEQDVADLDEFGNDFASRKEFQDLQNAFPDTGPFDGIPADGSVLDQQNGINNIFGQNR